MSVTSVATVKFAVEVADPPLVVTATGPVVVPAPMTAVSELPVEVVTPVAAVPFTVTLVALHKLVPVTVISVVAFPVVGVNDVMVGAPLAAQTRGVPRHAAGTFTTVPEVDAEIDHGAVH